MANHILTKSPGSTFTAAIERELILRMLSLRDTIKPAPCPIYNLLPALDRLIELLSYSPETGKIIHCLTRGQGKTGQEAGTPASGYRQIYVDLKPYKAHRLGWKIHYGADPKGQIDHVNGIRYDNRISNLRDFSPLENSRNRHVAKSNSGHIGISFCRRSHRYVACIGLGDRTVHLGQFVRLKCAIAARECGEEWLYGPLPVSADNKQEAA